MSTLRTLPRKLSTLWAFSRPHTIIGTSLAVVLMYVFAAAQRGAQAGGLLALAWLSGLSVNLYIVGLNQLTDVEIDRINKPDLPLAAGTLSPRAALWIVALSGAAALALAAAGGAWLFATIAVIFSIGTAYSLPPIRLKRFPLWAGLSIMTARALVLNAGLSLAYSARLSGDAQVPPQVLLFIGFMLGYVGVIAVMKDVPDLEGDRLHRIPTFVARLGAGRTLFACHVTLTAFYVGAAAIARAATPGLSFAVLAGGHGIAVATLWSSAATLDPDDRNAVYRHYMRIWALFYFEFLVFGVAAIAAFSPNAP